MNIRDLEYIVAVDELKSFIKASKKCFVSQPALSMQIQKAENLLGIKIFERTRKNIITTPEGQKIIDYAKEILKTFEFIKTVKNDGSQVKIGIIHTISPYLLPRIISPLQKNFADIKMFFVEGKTKDLLETLTKGELDAVILSHNYTQVLDKKAINYNALNTNPLYKERFFMTTPKGGNIENGQKLTKDQFKQLIENEKIIMLDEGHCMKDELSDICKSYYENTKNSKEAQFFATSIETIKHMIKLGNGISILPELSIEKNKDEGLYYAELPEDECRTISIVFRKNTSKGDILNNIFEIVTKTINAEAA